MSRRGPRTITRAVNAAARTGDEPSEDVYAEIYRELRRLADRELRRESNRNTLDTTMLVHEAYVRLTEKGTGPWDSRWHFYGAAARAMRRILVDAARKRGIRRKALDELARDGAEESPSLQPDLMALDDALNDLEAIDRRLAEVVMLRYFAGLTHQQVAELLGTSERTIKRDWRYAKAWLFRRLATDLESDISG